MRYVSRSVQGWWKMGGGECGCGGQGGMRYVSGNEQGWWKVGGLWQMGVGEGGHTGWGGGPGGFTDLGAASGLGGAKIVPQPEGPWQLGWATCGGVDGGEGGRL